MQLTDTDRNVIRQMREEYILEDIAANRMSGTGRNIIVICSDGHQCPDILATHTALLQKHGSECCNHTLALNGGALNIDQDFIVEMIRQGHCRHRLDEVLLDQIGQSMRLKDTTAIGLYIHVPCGAAGLLGLSFEQTLGHLFKAKKRLWERFTDRPIKVGCYVQIAQGEKRNTYFISRKNWEAWNARSKQSVFA